MVRVDQALVERGLCQSREKAKCAVMAGRVSINDRLARKPSDPVKPADTLILLTPDKYVSRGGLKLEHALNHFHLDVAGRTAIDLGASTGGFTDCLLQHGAARVYAVDVGYGQLAWQLQQDSRVVRLDRTNITRLQPADIDPPADLAVIDASFTSLRHLLQPVLRLLVPEGELLCLVKPQFEARRGAVAHGGIVRDEKHYQEALRSVALAMRSSGLFVCGIAESPICGAKGNREFFIYARKLDMKA